MDKKSYHQSIQKSSTLNRKYVTRPTIHIEIADALAEEPALIETDEPLVPEEPLRSILQAPTNDIIDRPRQINVTEVFAEPVDAAKETEEMPPVIPEAPDLPPETHPYQRIINQVTVNSSEGGATPPPTPRELKNEAIKKALHQLDEQKEEKAVSEVVAAEKKAKKQLNKSQVKKSKKQTKRTLSDSFKKEKRHSSFGKFVLAFATSAACIGVLGYFVSLNMPSISVRVAAMQTGIEASYPTYVPRDYQLSGVSTGDNNTVTISFSGKNDDTFYIKEEKSSWDSNALLNNYVKAEWGDDYDILREQGITLYVHNSNAVWVNGGILYKLNTIHGSLSKKIIKNIALSL